MNAQNTIYRGVIRLGRTNSDVLHYGDLSHQFYDAVQSLPDYRPPRTIEEPLPEAGGRLPDEIYRSRAVEHFLLLSVEKFSDVNDILRGAQQVILAARLDWISLPKICYLPGLLPPDIAQMIAENFVRIDLIDPEINSVNLGDFDAPMISDNNFILVHRKLIPLLMIRTDKDQATPVLDEVVQKFNIRCNGVIHVGANIGQEVEYYIKNKYFPIVMIEADPQLAEYQRQIHAHNPDIFVVNVASTDVNGPVSFHITGNNQGSSLLVPSDDGIAEFGEAFHVTKNITVNGQRLDDTIRDIGLEPEMFSLLYLDIQGAEVMALRGAETILQHVDLILCEINFLEHYAGSAQIEDVDTLLADAGFTRVAIDCSYSASWGDGFYIRTSLMPS